MDPSSNTLDTSLNAPSNPTQAPTQGWMQETERKLKGYSYLLLFIAVVSQVQTVEALCGWSTGLEGAGWSERLLAASWPLGYGLAMAWSFRAALRRPVWAFGVPLALQSLITVLKIVEHGVLGLKIVEQGVLGLIGVLFLYFLFWRPFVAARKLEWLRRDWKHDLPGDVA